MKNQPSVSPRKVLENRYNSVRYDILLIFIFTVINILLPLLTDSNTFFLFSAEVPYYIFAIGWAMVEGEMLSSIVYPLVLALLITVPYLLFWIFSKKRYGWMIAALVYFSIDCLFLGAMSLSLEYLAEIIFHLVALGLLIYGVVLGAKLKKMPKDEPSAETPMAEGHSSEENQ